MGRPELMLHPPESLIRVVAHTQALCQVVTAHSSCLISLQGQVLRMLAATGQAASAALVGLTQQYLTRVAAAFSTAPPADLPGEVCAHCCRVLLATSQSDMAALLLWPMAAAGQIARGSTR